MDMGGLSLGILGREKPANLEKKTRSALKVEV
jgi:hypothetical protein